MKIKEKKLPEGKIALEVRASAKEVEKAFTSAFRQFVNSAGIKPERNKTVNEVVEEKLGIKDLDSALQDSALEMLIPYAIDKCGLIPSFPPQIIESAPLRREREATFTLEMMPKKHYELSSYDPVSITVPPFSLDESLVDCQIEELAKRSSQYVRAAEQHEVRNGDAVLLEMESFESGKRISGLSFGPRVYVCGAGFMPQGFDEGIIGMKPGDTKTFSFDGSDFNDAGKAISTTIEATVTVIELQEECTPQVNDVWLAQYMPMYKNVDELRADIRRDLEANAREQYDSQCRQAAISQLRERFEGRIPDEAYIAVRTSLMRDLSSQLQEQGITYKDYVEQQGGEQQFFIMTMLQARETLAQGYALDALFSHEKLTLTDEDYLKAAKELNPKADPIQTRRQLEDTGRKFILKEAAERRKAADFLLEHADIAIEG